MISLDAILFHNGEHTNSRNHENIMLARGKGTYARVREKGKAGGAKGKRERARPTIWVESH